MGKRNKQERVFGVSFNINLFSKNVLLNEFIWTTWLKYFLEYIQLKVPKGSMTTPGKMSTDVTTSL